MLKRKEKKKDKRHQLITGHNVYGRYSRDCIFFLFLLFEFEQFFYLLSETGIAIVNLLQIVYHSFPTEEALLVRCAGIQALCLKAKKRKKLEWKGENERDSGKLFLSILFQKG